jgi:hypothetical protein
MYRFVTHRSSSVYQLERVKSIGCMSVFACVVCVEAIFAENDWL